jgi:hypothetical protein
MSSDVGAESSATSAKPVGEDASATIAAVDVPDATSASAASRLATCVTSRFGMPLTYCCASAVTATDVVETVGRNPAQTTSASAPMNRIREEMMKALLRSFDRSRARRRATRSARSWARPGWARGHGGADVVTG